MKTREELVEFLNQFNRSELTALAVANEIPGFYRAGAPRYLPRETLIDILIDYRVMPDLDPLQGTREEIELWMKRYWMKMESQVRYSHCPECVNGKALPGDQFVRCSEVQVANCYRDNKKNLDAQRK